MRKPIVFMYSGQGAQYFQMGRELFDQEPVFRQAMERCDSILAPRLGGSLIDVLYGPQAKKMEPFERTLHTHPAIVAFSYCLTKTLQSRGIQPDYLLGYSLGEYVASIVSGAQPLEQGLERILAQAELLEAKTPKAGMMAILEEPEIMRRFPDLFEGCWLAGHNFQGHIVVTGYRDRLELVDQTLRQRQITCQILPISHGFHSPLVDPIAADCLSLFTDFTTPRLPVISCRETTEIQDFSGEHLWRVLRQPIRFLETLRRLEAGYEYAYIDVGPAGTLSTFAKYALGRGSRSQCLAAVNQFGRDLKTLDQLQQALAR